MALSTAPARAGGCLQPVFLALCKVVDTTFLDLAEGVGCYRVVGIKDSLAVVSR